MRSLHVLTLLAGLTHAQPFSNDQQADNEETHLVIQLQAETTVPAQINRRLNDVEANALVERQYSFPPVTITGHRPKATLEARDSEVERRDQAMDEEPDLVERQYSFPPVTITGHPPKPTIKDAGAKRAREVLHQEEKRDGTIEVPTVTIIVKPTDMPRDRDAGPIAKSKRSLAEVLGDVMGKRWVVPEDDADENAA